MKTFPTVLTERLKSFKYFLKKKTAQGSRLNI